MSDSSFDAVRWARVAGIVCLAIIVLGFFGEMVARSSIIVSGDAARTAANLIASEGLWRAGIVGDLLMHVLDVPAIIIFYLLLKPVNRGLALTAALFNMIQTAVLVANKLTLVAAHSLATDRAQFSAGFHADLDALAHVAIQMHGYGFGVGLIFFGFASLLRGYLIFRSGFLPRFLGILLGIGGVCYLVNSFALLLAPALASALFPTILMPAAIGELALALWLAIKSVDGAAWRRCVTASTALRTG
jgi:hypothetical protein